MENTTPAGSAPNTLMVILSYLFPLSLIPLFTDKSADIQYHAKQGTVNGILILVINVVGGIIAGVTGLSIIAFVCSLLSIVLFVFAIIAIIKGLGGELYSIPVVGGLVSKVPTP